MNKLLLGVAAIVLFAFWLFTQPPCTEQDVGFNSRSCVKD